jgi:hypothetical protein
LTALALRALPNAQSNEASLLFSSKKIREKSQFEKNPRKCLRFTYSSTIQRQVVL